MFLEFILLIGFLSLLFALMGFISDYILSGYFLDYHVIGRWNRWKRKMRHRKNGITLS